MISRRAHEIASIVGKRGGMEIEMTCEQVERWYDHLCTECGKEGNNTLSPKEKDKIIFLHGIGCGISDISNRTGHTRVSVKHVLYEHSSDTLPKRVKEMQIYEMFRSV